jgi:hypothetical protein
MFAIELSFSPTACSGRCYSWFVAIDQDGSGEISPQELRTCPFVVKRATSLSHGEYRERTHQ